MENRTNLKDNILYTFRRCPYAMRARWSFIKTKTSFIWREVDLKSKPKELFKISPKGTVPVLINYNGEVIDESVDIMKWVILNSQESFHDLLRLKNKNECSIILNIIKQNDSDFKFHLDRYKYADRDNSNQRDFHRNYATKILREWNSRIEYNMKDSSKIFLVGKYESIADWATWPFVRQFKNVDIEFFNNCSGIDLIQRWLEYYVEDKLFNLLMSRSIPWEESNHPIYFPT